MENSKILFSEKQKPHQWQIQTFIILYSIFLTYMVIKQIFFNIPFLSMEIPDSIVIILWILFAVLVPVLYYKSYMLTEVREDGLYLKYFPFHQKLLKLPLAGLVNVEIITYDPMKDYGGWGIRIGAKGHAFNAYGNRGVNLKFANSKELLIGSQKPEELFEALKLMTNFDQH